MKPVEEAYKLMLSEACAKGKKEGMDPVGREDGDIDNDGDKDSSDKYLRKRREAIKQSMEEGAAAALQMATAKRRQAKSKEQNDAQDSSSDLSLQVDAFGKKPDHKVFPVDTFDQPKKMDADAKKIDGGVGAGKGKLPGDTASREPMQKVTQKEEAELDVEESMKHAQYANLVGGLKKKKDKAADDKYKSITKKQYGNMMGGLKKGWNEETDLDEAELLELKKSTLSSYIQKASDPLRKNSNVNLASRAANKLATSGNDMSAGEKEDNKAYTRSKGIQTAAKKLAKEEVGLEEGNGQEADQLSGLISKYNVNGTAKGGQEACDTKSIKKFDIKGFKAATQEPLEKVSEEYDEAKAAHDHGVKDATAGRPKKNASDIYAQHGGHYHAGYDSVKQKQK